jgi:hypothetical protein
MISTFSYEWKRKKDKRKSYVTALNKAQYNGDLEGFPSVLGIIWSWELSLRFRHLLPGNWPDIRRAVHIQTQTG